MAIGRGFGAKVVVIGICVLALLMFKLSLRPNQQTEEEALVPSTILILPNSHTRRLVSSHNPQPLSPLSVLLPDWQILVMITDQHNNQQPLTCVFQNNATSPARLVAGANASFKCTMPNSVRRLRPFLMPTLTTTNHNHNPTFVKDSPQLYRWSFLVYECYTTENDVVLFVKGVNHRQGFSRSPQEFTCVFSQGGNAVRTAVTSSSQEVFRCAAPDLTAFHNNNINIIRVSLEINSEENLMVPSVARYIPRGTLALPPQRKLLCATTMVYNAAKFLTEWVTYHSSIGVQKFILYDNDSDDDLNHVVSELNGQGFDVTTTFWVWPKTQEAGFSHSALHNKESCDWMVYVDVDEFVFSPAWSDSSRPSTHMLKSLLPRPMMIGQVSIRCNEFGPSNQRSHPKEGVTQGYTCRRSMEQRHKSIVFLEAVDGSLLNVVHHFRLRSNYVTKTLSIETGIVNHYKYQAWPEFRNKFRRRVSTYVVDWTKRSNMDSKDRTPGLGFHPIQPSNWANKFCEVTDERLALITRTWFPTSHSKLYNMLDDV